MARRTSANARHTAAPLAGNLPRAGSEVKSDSRTHSRAGTIPAPQDPVRAGARRAESLERSKGEPALAAGARRRGFSLDRAAELGLPDRRHLHHAALRAQSGRRAGPRLQPGRAGRGLHESGAGPDLCVAARAAHRSGVRARPSFPVRWRRGRCGSRRGSSASWWAQSRRGPRSRRCCCSRPAPSPTGRCARWRRCSSRRCCSPRSRSRCARRARGAGAARAASSRCSR